MNKNKFDKLMEALYSNCRIKVVEARELSWRKFFKEAGGRENLAKIEGKEELRELLKVSEVCFLEIVENRLSDEEIKELIALPPTQTWINEENNRPIELKKNVISKTI